MSIWKGKNIEIEVFGKSHDAEIGVRIKGLKDCKVDLNELQSFVDRRKASNFVGATKRREEDKVEIKYEDDVIVGVIKNLDIKSSDYDSIKFIPRPSHADYTQYIKYGTIEPGGGKFSGRMTAALMIAGGIAKQLVEDNGITVKSFVSSIGNYKYISYKDRDFDLKKINSLDYSNSLEQIEDDSIGGRVECVICGLKAGIGDDLFDGMESSLSQLMLSIPAVKGIEFGDGFDLCEMMGSIANDEFYYDGDSVKTHTNHNGGINGGISNGMPITFALAIKPTPSISKEQNSIDLNTKQNVKMQIKGRHDKCIALRVPPICEALVWLYLCDQLLK